MATLAASDSISKRTRDQNNREQHNNLLSYIENCKLQLEDQITETEKNIKEIQIKRNRLNLDLLDKQSFILYPKSLQLKVNPLIKSMQLSVDIDRMIKEENAKKFISKISRDRKSREAREYLRKANEISIEMKDISENRPNYIKSVARKKLEKKLLEDHKHLDDYFVLNKYSKYHEYNKILNQRNIEKLDKKLDRKLERLEESKFHDVEAIKRDKIQYLKQKYLVQ